MVTAWATATRASDNCSRKPGNGWPPICSLFCGTTWRAPLLGDPRRLDDSVLFYLRSIFSAYRLSHGFLRECFTLLRHQLAARLEPDDLSALAPYLERNIEVLASGAEPTLV